MKTFFLTLFAGLFLFAGIVQSDDSQKKICIVGFERRDFPVSLGLKKVFKENAHTRLVIEGGPKDLETCFQENLEEIILVTHAFFVDENNERAVLGYFQELKGVARSSFIEMNKKLILEKLSDLELSIKEMNTVKKRLERRQFRKLLKRVEETPSDLPLYPAPQLLHPTR